MARLWMVLAVVLLPTPVWGLVGGMATQSYPSVFIWTGDPYALDETYCTASKISPHAFLSAAHCVLDYAGMDEKSNLGDWNLSSDFIAGKKIKLSFAKQITEGVAIESAVIKKVHLHPLLEECLRGGSLVYCRNSRTPLPDLVIVEIETGRKHSQFDRAPYLAVSRELVIPRHAIVMMGYGYQGEEDTQPPTLKVAINYTETTHALAAYLQHTSAVIDGIPRADTFFGAPGILLNEDYANLGSGDSGGPVIDALTGAIVGVNSDGYCPLAKPECERTTNSFFSRLDDYALGSPGRWISDILLTGGTK